MKKLKSGKLPDRLKSAKKAYDNSKFLHSRDGRVLRILSEYLHPEQYLRKHGIKKTIIFFGSARIRSTEFINTKINELELKLKQNPENQDLLIDELSSYKKKLITSKYYDDAVVLSKMLAEWSMTLPKANRFHICTGGGPGIMEAANKGSYEAGMDTIGFNISLPFEQEPNRFITPSLNFEFHYFFMRKFWLVYLSQCMVVFPGGFGTIDEMMEVLTLRQTGKMRKPRLVVLYGEEFWKNVINFDYLSDTEVIHSEDENLYKYVNTPQEAFDYITDQLANHPDFKINI